MRQQHTECEEAAYLTNGMERHGWAVAPEAFGRKRAPILGVPDRRCRKRIEPSDSDRAGERHETLEMRQGGGDALGIQLAGLAKPTTEPAENLLVEQRYRRARQRVVDHEPNRIGADVDD